MTRLLARLFTLVMVFSMPVGGRRDATKLRLSNARAQGEDRTERRMPSISTYGGKNGGIRRTFGGDFAMGFVAVDYCRWNCFSHRPVQLD